MCSSTGIQAVDNYLDSMAGGPSASNQSTQANAYASSAASYFDSAADIPDEMRPYLVSLAELDPEQRKLAVKAAGWSDEQAALAEKHIGLAKSIEGLTDDAKAFRDAIAGLAPEQVEMARQIAGLAPEQLAQFAAQGQVAPEILAVARQIQSIGPEQFKVAMETTDVGRQLISQAQQYYGAESKIQQGLRSEAEITPAALQAARSRATADVSREFAAASETRQRDMERRGVTQGSGAAEADRRTLAIEEAKARASGADQADRAERQYRANLGMGLTAQGAQQLQTGLSGMSAGQQGYGMAANTGAQAGAALATGAGVYGSTGQNIGGVAGTYGAGIAGIGAGQQGYGLAGNANLGVANLYGAAGSQYGAAGTQYGMAQQGMGTASNIYGNAANTLTGVLAGQQGMANIYQGAGQGYGGLAGGYLASSDTRYNQAPWWMPAVTFSGSRGGIVRAAGGGAVADPPGFGMAKDIPMVRSPDGFTMDPAMRAPAGGHVTGPGDETSDSIPAKVSQNEFILPAFATVFYGTDKLNKMVEKARLGMMGGGADGTPQRVAGEPPAIGGAGGAPPSPVHAQGGGLALPPVGQPRFDLGQSDPFGLRAPPQPQFSPPRLQYDEPDGSGMGMKMRMGGADEAQGAPEGKRRPFSVKITPQMIAALAAA